MFWGQVQYLFFISDCRTLKFLKMWCNPTNEEQVALGLVKGAKCVKIEKLSKARKNIRLLNTVTVERNGVILLCTNKHDDSPYLHHWKKIFYTVLMIQFH